MKSWLNDKFTITKNKITDWPSTFPPSSHTHTISQITDLQNQLNGKSSTSHNHDGRYLKNIRVINLSDCQKSTINYETRYTLPSMSIGEIIYFNMEGDTNSSRLLYAKESGSYMVLLADRFTRTGSASLGDISFSVDTVSLSLIKNNTYLGETVYSPAFYPLITRIS